MARQQGVRSVGKVEDRKVGASAEIKLETDTMTFYANVGGERFASKDGEVVRRWTREALRKLRLVEWVPVIIIATNDEDANPRHFNGRELESICANLSIESRRTYLANVAKNIQELDWSVYKRIENHQERIDASHYAGLSRAFDLSALPFSDKFMTRDETTTHVLAYDESTWLGIQKIHESVSESRNNLNAILRHKKGPEFLAMVGTGAVDLPTSSMPSHLRLKSGQ